MGDLLGEEGDWSMPELEEQGYNYSDEELESDDESEEENFLEDTNL